MALAASAAAARALAGENSRGGPGRAACRLRMPHRSHRPPLAHTIPPLTRLLAATAARRAPRGGGGGDGGGLDRMLREIAVYIGGVAAT